MGMLNESHSTMKLVAFWQASGSSAPPLNSGLLAMKPTLLPFEPREHRGDRAPEALLQLEARVLVRDRGDDLAHVVHLVARLRQDLEDLPARLVRAGRHRVLGRRLHRVRRQVGKKPLHRVERLLVGVHGQVREPGDAGQQLPAAQLLRIHRLADRERGDVGARDRHDRALAHHHEIRHRGIPGRGAVALAQQRRHPRRLAQALVLGRVLGEDGAARGAHAVGHARAGGFAEQHERHAAAGTRRPSRAGSSSC